MIDPFAVDCVTVLFVVGVTAMVVHRHGCWLRKEHRTIEKELDQMGVRPLPRPVIQAAERADTMGLYVGPAPTKTIARLLSRSEQSIAHATAEAEKEWAAFESGELYVWTPFVFSERPKSPSPEAPIYKEGAGTSAEGLSPDGLARLAALEATAQEFEQAVRSGNATWPRKRC